MENRTDSGHSGLDALAGGRGNLVVERLERVNHFGMMEGRGVCGLALVEKALN